MSDPIINQKIRVRAAPSPTGSPHIGNLRTFLFDFLAARHYGGAFVLRIEDTDKKREIELGVSKLKELLDAYGLEADEGPDIGGKYGPYIQSERKQIYQKHAEMLVEEGHAYKCFCTEERLENLREQQKKDGKQTRYDGFCRDLSKKQVAEQEEKGLEHVIRLKVPKKGICEFDDLVFGSVKIPYKSIDDQILIKRNGLPTYHFGVVVDDHLMEITHVLRGSEYVSSTPKDILMYEAFGWDIPKWVHMPLIVGQNGKKLGKREGALPALEYLRQGYLPEAVINYLALLGWNPGDETTVMTKDELIKKFSFERIHKSPAKFDAEKFLWINGEHIRKLNDDKFEKSFMDWLSRDLNGLIERDYLGQMVDDNVLGAKLSLVKERSKTLLDAANQIRFFYYRPAKEIYINSDVDKLSSEILEKLLKIHEEVDISDQVKWEESVRKLADEYELKHGDVFMQLRVAVSGSKFSPPLRESLVILGKDELLDRIGNYIMS